MQSSVCNTSIHKNQLKQNIVENNCSEVHGRCSCDSSHAVAEECGHCHRLEYNQRSGSHARKMGEAKTTTWPAAAAPRWQYANPRSLQKRCMGSSFAYIRGKRISPNVNARQAYEHSAAGREALTSRSPFSHPCNGGHVPSSRARSRAAVPRWASSAAWYSVVTW